MLIDLRSALSNLFKTLALRQVKSGSQNEKTTLSDVKDFLRYVMAVTTALLDAFASVAASVILSLLLISGNVERNPGPGRYPGTFVMLNCLHLVMVFAHYRP